MKNIIYTLPLLLSTGIANAQTIDWLDWTATSTSSAKSSAYGKTINYSSPPNGSDLKVDSTIYFRGAPSSWDRGDNVFLRDEFESNAPTSTNKFVVNLGSLSASESAPIYFAATHMAYEKSRPSAYTMRAYDLLGQVVPLNSSVSVVGNYDLVHPGGSTYKDADLSLDLTNGKFTITVVSPNDGNDDLNSDGLVLRLNNPRVNRLEIFNDGPVTLRDTVFYAVGVEAVPEPSSTVLLGLSAIGGLLLRKRTIK